MTAVSHPVTGWFPHLNIPGEQVPKREGGREA